MLIITIIQGKEKSLLAGEPWIYASAIERVEGKPQEKMKPGSTAIVQSSAKKFLARAAYNSKSQIRARVWTFDESEPVDHAMIKRRVKSALEKRAASLKKAGANQLLSLIKGEEDGLPGLLVDLYGGAGGYLVCQFQAGGVDAWKVPIVQALMAGTGCANVYERCDPLIRKGEGLPVISGALAGEEPPQEVMLTENGVRFALDLATGERSKLR
ncbi:MULTISPECIES: SAM-dependent methyltransferase [unclassified Janthinobacterium]|uniref:SAM-dependent methyltransferase n=1 Tax=unclassified Janthinobacterium TaxID=2610881 RepID=UPI00034BA1DE|nr:MULTISPECIES: SAM-dependent methyltransferase [unclassified Janthinobacterium]MEC5164223.1 23S rRNA (cytosine1962-C5)-methyltransferase [Janthinobacterium sp. CG_S6]